MNLTQLFESDMSGVMHAARHHNKSFIITANVDGAKKKFRVNHQTADLAKDKFLQHHSMAKILDVQQEGVTEVRDRRDAYQRDYDSSVSGMGRRNSYAYSQDGGGNDERHDLDPTDWYFVKDGKMFKVSVYPNQEQQAIALGYSRTRDEAKAKVQQGVAEGQSPISAGRRAGKAGKPLVPPHPKDSPEYKEFEKGWNEKENIRKANKLAPYNKQGVTEGERTMSRAAKGYEKYGKAGMQALAKASREGKDLDKIRDKYNKYNESVEQGVSEGSQRVDSLVTDALKIMQGSEASDAVAALKTVLGNREYNGRRGYYNFYVRQLMDMYGQQGVAEGYNAEYDDEAGMADNNLETLKRAVQGLDNVINAGDNLPEWCQEKIAVSKSMLVSVWDYMLSEKEKN